VTCVVVVLVLNLLDEFLDKGRRASAIDKRLAVAIANSSRLVDAKALPSEGESK
jgi:hypothetical protein